MRFLGNFHVNGVLSEVYEDTQGTRYARPMEATAGDGYMRDVLHDGPEHIRMKSKYFELSEGDAGIRETLQRMKGLARKGAHHATVMKVSRSLVGSNHPLGKVPVRDQKGETARLLDWTQKNIRWTPDIGDAETLMAPHRTIQFGAGDCDDSAMVLAALATSIGIPNRFKAIAANEQWPQEFTHVYNELKIGGRWVAADPSVEGMPLGWESPKIFRVMTEDVWTPDEIN
jgi:hypothetical protein